MSLYHGAKQELIMEEAFLDNVKEVLGIDDRDIQMTDEFRSFDEWSSLAFMSLIAMLEDEYDLKVDVDRFKLLETVGDVWQVVKAARS